MRFPLRDLRNVGDDLCDVSFLSVDDSLRGTFELQGGEAREPPEVAFDLLFHHFSFSECPMNQISKAYSTMGFFGA